MDQSSLFKPEDIIPVPCHPDCLAMGYALKLGGKTVPLTSMIDPKVLLQGEGNTIVYEAIPSCAIMFSSFSPLRIHPSRQ